MATYNIENVNYGANLVNPTISVNRKLNAFDPDALTVAAVVCFDVTTAAGDPNTIKHILYDIPILSLTYDHAEIVAAVMARLSTPEYLVP